MYGTLCAMPWIPELFSTRALAHVWDQQARQDRLASVPYFAGLMTGETAALIDSFAHEPELHHPTRGRIKGAAAFERFVADTNQWLVDRHVELENVGLIATDRRTVEEVVARLDGKNGRVELPIAIAADRDDDARLLEVRVYFSTWPLSDGHAIRPPLLQPNPETHDAGIVGDYQRALAAGDVEAVLATFESDGYAREPSGGAYVHRGSEELRAMYERFFSNGGGIPLEHCASTDDGRVCAIEYNVVRWGETELPPQAGIGVFVRGASGKLAIARIYDDADPPLTARA